MTTFNLGLKFTVENTQDKPLRKLSVQPYWERGVISVLKPAEANNEHIALAKTLYDLHSTWAHFQVPLGFVPVSQWPGQYTTGMHSIYTQQ